MRLVNELAALVVVLCLPLASTVRAGTPPSNNNNNSTSIVSVALLINRLVSPAYDACTSVPALNVGNTSKGMPSLPNTFAREWQREARAESSALWYWLREAEPLATARFSKQPRGALTSEQLLQTVQFILDDWRAQLAADVSLQTTSVNREPTQDLAQLIFFLSSLRVARRVAARSNDREEL
jgi:hypothetical protein